ILAQRGATLVEALLACSLSGFLLASLMQVYLSSKQTFALQQNLAAMQENGHFAVYFLNQNIRMAGYAYCNQSTQLVNQDLAISGFDSALPDYLQNKVAPGTDSIVIGLCRLENGKMTFSQYAFFIGATSRKNALGQTITALYQMPITGSKEELVPD